MTVDPKRTGKVYRLLIAPDFSNSNLVRSPELRYVGDMSGDICLSPRISPTAIESMVIGVAILALRWNQVHVVPIHANLDRDILNLGSVSPLVHPIEQIVVYFFQSFCRLAEREMNKSMLVPLLIAVPFAKDPLGLTLTSLWPAHSWIMGPSRVWTLSRERKAYYLRFHVRECVADIGQHSFQSIIANRLRF